MTHIFEQKTNRIFFKKLNSYHSNIKFTIEKNPLKFLYTEIIQRAREIKQKFTISLKNLQCISLQKFQPHINVMP